MDYLALDIETTGLSPEKDRIIEIGAVKYRDGKQEDSFSCLIQNIQPLPWRIVELTGITDEMLAGGRKEEEAILAFLEFAEDMPVLLGHNILFDYSFLKVTALRHGKGFERSALDTLQFSRILHPELSSRSLAAMCSYYGIQQEHAHRAVEDAISAHRLYECLQQKFPQFDGFRPTPLCYKEKKREPITPKQKKYLIDLLKYHKIEFTQDMEQLSKSEASRTIDKIILEKGRIINR